jgi:hypothetical protein
VVEAIAKLHKTLMDTLNELHKAKAAEVAIEYVRLLVSQISKSIMAEIDPRRVQNLSLAIGCMKPSLKTKLRTMEAAVTSSASMAR